MLITFEGIEGSGKTTQIHLLAKILQERGYAVVLTREPGGTAIGDQIRQILLDNRNKNIVLHCELLLYYASRAQHVEEVIRPALLGNQIVLCDRFTDATVAYQSYGRGIDKNIIHQLDQLVLKDVKINITFLFDLPAEMGLARAKKRAEILHPNSKEDRFENEEIDFHRRVRVGYLEIAQKHSKRFKILDAQQDVQTLHKQLLVLLEGIL